MSEIPSSQEVEYLLEKANNLAERISLMPLKHTMPDCEKMRKLYLILGRNCNRWRCLAGNLRSPSLTSTLN